MGQGSALSPILSVLYIVPLLHLSEQWAQALNLDTSILSYVDDGLLASQGKTYDKTLLELSHSYSVIADLMGSFGLVMEHDKSEIFYFSRVHNNTNPELDLSAIGASIPSPRHTSDTWAFTLIDNFFSRTLIDNFFSRSMFDTTLSRHCLL